jgi:hypothetical protein
MQILSLMTNNSPFSMSLVLAEPGTYRLGIYTLIPALNHLLEVSIIQVSEDFDATCFKGWNMSLQTM